MRKLHFTRPNRLSKLHDEILAAVPSVRPTPDASGDLYAVMTVESRGNDIWLTVPDDTDDAAIMAVVAAHDATPDLVPEPPDFGTDAVDLATQSVSAVAGLRAYLAIAPAAVTPAQRELAFRLVIRVVLALVRLVAPNGRI